jgi:hypothetical protein
MNIRFGAATVSHPVGNYNQDPYEQNVRRIIDEALGSPDVKKLLDYAPSSVAVNVRRGMDIVSSNDYCGYLKSMKTAL